MTSHLMKAGNDIRHTLFGAFSPTQNVTTKLRGSLERVTYANLFPALLNFLHSVRGQSVFFNLALTERIMQVKFDLKLSVYSLGVDI